MLQNLDELISKHNFNRLTFVILARLDDETSPAKDGRTPEGSNHQHLFAVRVQNCSLADGLLCHEGTHENAINCIFILTQICSHVTTNVLFHKFLSLSV